MLASFPGTSVGLAALAVVIAWFSIFPADSSVTSDDGAYAIEVMALEDGGWSVPHVLAEVDVEGVAYPYRNASVTDEGWFPGARHAVWVRILALGNLASGPVGMHAVSAVWLAVAVAGTATLSHRLGHGDLRVLAAVLLAASPLLFLSLQLWGHAAVVAGASIGMVAAVEVLKGPIRWRVLVLGAAGFAFASALRGDGLIFALAVAGTVGLAGLRRRSGAVVFAGALLALSSLSGYVASKFYSSSILGEARIGVASTASGDGTESRLDGLVQTFFSTSDGAGPFLLLAVSLVLVAGAVWRLRRGDGERATALLLVAAVAWTVRLIAHPDAAATGLLGAWPVVLLAFGRPWRAFGDAEKYLALALAIAAIGIGMTQYEGGGGLNWGGRYIAPALPALAVFAAAGLRFGAARSEHRRAVIAATSLLVMCTVGASLVFDATLRTRHDRIVDRVAADLPGPVVTSSPALPRIAWRTYPDVQWLRMPDDPKDARGAAVLAELVREAGIREIVLFHVPAEDTAALTGGRVVRDTSRPTPVRVP